VIINDTVTGLLACVGLSVILVILMQLLATILNLLWFVGDTRFNKKQKLKSKTKSFEILQGEWIYNTDEFSPKMRCSVCGYNKPIVSGENIKQEPDNYCGKCGSKMKGGADNVK
jgi:hypothetical protein